MLLCHMYANFQVNLTPRTGSNLINQTDTQTGGAMKSLRKLTVNPSLKRKDLWQKSMNTPVPDS